MTKISPFAKQFQKPDSVVFVIKDRALIGRNYSEQLYKDVKKLAHDEYATTALETKQHTLIATPEHAGRIFTGLQELGVKFSAIKGKVQKPTSANAPSALAKK